MPKRDFDKVAKAWVFTLNLLHIFRARFSKNISGGCFRALLLLSIYIEYHSKVRNRDLGSTSAG